MSSILDKIGGNIKKKIEDNKKEQVKEYKISAQNDVLILENYDFDYTAIDMTTAEYLKQKEYAIKNIFSKAYTEIGEILAEAQDKLANHSGGIFEKWYESLGFKKDKVYRLISRYKLVIANSENRIIVENLPLSLSYEIAKETCSNDLKEKVLSGEIKTLKEFNEAKEQNNAPDKIEVFIDDIKFRDKIITFEKRYEDFRKNIFKDFSDIENEKRVKIYNELKRIEKKIDDLLKEM